VFHPVFNEMKTQWETVIGLEIHVQLATHSKIFSGTSTAFGAPPNTQASGIDIALPGTLPVLNAAAVRMAVKFGVAIGADVSSRCVFDRKNYFYPDLPKGYQISQFAQPIVGAGSVELRLDDGSTRTIRITRAHLEEDAGKSLHEDFAGMTGIDLNRAGMPLLEIVSEPDLRTSKEAAAYFRQMHTLVRYLEICDGNLNEGSMRCDANVSVRPAGATELGERTELKNLNSFRFLERAIDHEVARQIELIEKGGTVRRETRLYDPDRDETRTMRTKELSDDYRYFPEPDLLPVAIDAAFIESVRAELPELPRAKRRRYVEALGLSEYDASRLTDDPALAHFYEATLAVCNEPKPVANWVLGELSAALNRDELQPSQTRVTAKQLGTLVERTSSGSITVKIAKSLFEPLWRANDPSADVDALIEAQGLEQVSDSDELAALIRKIVADNPAQVAQFRAGREKVFGFFVGQAMKATQGRANPQRLNELLREALAQH
jgi:aspartyl-tRNA(Asn)/glutamyl-tRNA(Gln) amidotransferase subunit B